MSFNSLSLLFSKNEGAKISPGYWFGSVRELSIELEAKQIILVVEWPVTLESRDEPSSLTQSLGRSLQHELTSISRAEGNMGVVGKFSRSESTGKTQNRDIGRASGFLGNLWLKYLLFHFRQPDHPGTISYLILWRGNILSQLGSGGDLISLHFILLLEQCSSQLIFLHI